MIMTTETFGTATSYDDIAPAKAVKNTLLAELEAEAQRDIEQFVIFEVPLRPGWALKFSTLLEIEDVKRYQRAAQGKKKRIEDSDPIIQNGMPLVERNVAILKDGVEVEDNDGDPLTLGSHEFLAMMHETRAVQALLKFVGDGALLSMGGSFFRAAGYGEDLEPLDPTGS
jgi:hypothetical protein